jgi:hypothetical protein
MKKTIITGLLFFLVLMVTSLNLYAGKGSSLYIPYKIPDSVFYGKDIVIYNDPLQNQRNVHLSVAFNGWLYVSYTNATAGNAGTTVLRSTDNGATWTILNILVLSETAIATDLIVTGKNLTDLKLFVCGVSRNDTNTWSVWCSRLDPLTGAQFGTFFNESSSSPIYDVAISSDYKHPAVGTNPFSLGIIYSKRGNLKDSVIMVTSLDGGNTVGSRVLVGITDISFRKVAISYGISKTENTGRYFAAWEEINGSVSPAMGHIWTASTDPYVYSPVSNKIKLDSINSAYINLCINPSISVQQDTLDNGSGNITEVVLFDRYKTEVSRNEVTGYFTKVAVGSHVNWQPLNINQTGDDVKESNINFDALGNKFIVTYYDATTQKLLYVTNDKNLAYPNTWDIISDGYNDSTNLTDPYPKVDINPVIKKAANVWIAEGNAGGVAMFDAEYANYNGIPQNQRAETSLESVFPNPAETKSTFSFNLSRTERVSITLFSITGQELFVITDKSYYVERSQVTLDVSTLPAGSYFYTFRTEDYLTTGKIIVIK